MTCSPNDPTYQQAIRMFLFKGVPLEQALRYCAATTKNNRPTTHYIWRTQGDGKVRSRHAANNGRVFAWDSPPPTGHPGEDYGCRCVAEPYYPPESLPHDPPIESVYPELVLIPILRVAASIIRGIRSISANNLTQAQANNLKRFDRKLPSKAGPIEVSKGSNGQRIFKSDVPANKIPGSFSRYEKVVDRNGNTVSYTKTTYAPDGRIVHIKNK